MSLLIVTQGLADCSYDRALMIMDHVQITSIASISMSTHQTVDSIIQRVNQMVSTPRYQPLGNYSVLITPGLDYASS